MKVNSKLLILAITFCLVFSFAAQAYAATDISGHWARETIEQCLSKGIVAGMPDGTFQPNKNVTRAEFATMVNKAFGFKDADTDKKFSDIKDSDWYAEQVAIAAKTGYITGMPDGTFQPQRQCTRAEACVMIRRAAGMEEGKESALSVFKDMGSIPAFARGCVSALVSEGLIKGYPDGTFGPQAQITRAESLVMIYRTSTGDFEEPDEKVSVTGVELDRDTISISEGSTRKLKATVKPADATNKEVKWSTSDEEIATVDDDGLVKGIKVGKATVTVTTVDGEKTATCEVNVTRRSSGGGGGGTTTPQVKAVTADPSGGEVSAGTKVALETATEGATVYYTLDETKPTTSSIKYTEPITINSDTIIKAIAVKDKMKDSGVGTFKYTVKQSELPDEVEKLVANYLAGQTYVTITIKDAYVADIEAVYVNGEAAIQQTESPAEWRSALPGNVKKANIIITFDKKEPVVKDLIDEANSKVFYLETFGETRVQVKADATVTEVTVDGVEAIFNPSTGKWQADLPGDVISVEVTATDGTNIETVTLTAQ